MDPFRSWSVFQKKATAHSLFASPSPWYPCPARCDRCDDIPPEDTIIFRPPPQIIKENMGRDQIKRPRERKIFILTTQQPPMPRSSFRARLIQVTGGAASILLPVPSMARHGMAWQGVWPRDSQYATVSRGSPRRDKTK